MLPNNSRPVIFHVNVTGCIEILCIYIMKVVYNITCVVSTVIFNMSRLHDQAILHNLEDI